MKKIEDLVAGYMGLNPEAEWVLMPGSVDGGCEVVLSIFGEPPPEDFQRLYKRCDGIGVRRGDDVEWHFVPTSRLLEFKEVIEAWYVDTHPYLINCFLPLFDWNTGDASGFVMENGKWSKYVYEFSHEDYIEDPSSGWKGFFTTEKFGLLGFISSFQDA